MLHYFQTQIMVEYLSVFFPTFNEEGNIMRTLTNAQTVLKGLGLKNYEILVIDDGSKDSSAEVVNQATKLISNLRLISHKQNLGYGSALKTGFGEAKYDWVAFADADGQFDFSEIDKFIAKTDQAELILGYRLNRADAVFRSLLTFGWKFLAYILFGLRVKDYSCGFKLIKREAFQAVQPLTSEEKVTQIELLVKAQKLGFRFAEVGVHHYPRQFGNPTGGSIFSKVFFKSIFDLFSLWWQFYQKK